MSSDAGLPPRPGKPVLSASYARRAEVQQVSSAERRRDWWGWEWWNEQEVSRQTIYNRRWKAKHRAEVQAYHHQYWLDHKAAIKARCIVRERADLK